MSAISRINKVYLYLMGFLLVVTFILLHTNQNSSQTAATFLLAFSPLLLLNKNPVQQPNNYRLIIASVIGYVTVFLLQYFQREVSDIAHGAARNMLFILLLPMTILLTINLRPSTKQIFYLLFFASILSISPLITDILHHSRRGISATHPIFWGNMALCTGFLCLVFASRLNKQEQFLSYIALIFSIGASLWSGTRGGWITIPIMAIFLAWSKTVSVKNIILLTVSISILLVSYPDSRNKLLRTFNSPNTAYTAADGISASIRIDNSTKARLEMWASALDRFKQSPFIGNGLDGFYSAGNVEFKNQKNTIHKHYNHSHNDVLELLVISGLLGLLAYAAIFFCLARSYIHNLKSKQNQPFVFAGLLLLVEFFLFGLTENFMLNKMTVTYFSILNGLFIGSTLLITDTEKKDA